MNVLLAGSWDDAERDAWAQALQQALDEAGDAPLAPRLCLSREAVPAHDFDAAIVANPPPGSLAGLPRLRLIQSLWAGVDRLLADPTLPADVPVARMVDPQMNAAMAETALWAVLALHRGFFGNAQRQRQALWWQQPQRRAQELPVLILGCGQMGRGAAQRLVQQGYPVTAWSRAAPAAAEPGVIHVHGDAALWAAAARAQVLINLLPLTPATHGVLGAPLFAALPRGAAIVNLARGAHLVEADLLTALASGQIGHAVLDVFATEPLPAAHPFWSHPQIEVLPHVAALSDLRSAAAVAAANIVALQRGAPLAHLVGRERGY